MDPIKLRFYVEKYAKENRNIRLVEEFVPTSRKKSITGKFYAKHEAVLSGDEAKPEYVKIIEKYAVSVPRDTYKYRPPTVNMDYGWFAQSLIQRSTDTRLNFPARGCEFIKNELELRRQNEGIPVKKFIGVPFRT